eukprot:777814-Amphidinium_carterae.1
MYSPGQKQYIAMLPFGRRLITYANALAIWYCFRLPETFSTSLISCDSCFQTVSVGYQGLFIPVYCACSHNSLPIVILIVAIDFNESEAQRNVRQIYTIGLRVQSEEQ